MKNEAYQKTGYLHSDFRLFHLTSTEARDFKSHYHDFHKLLVFLQGSLSYYIEGETYQLQPYDIVLVPAGEVHRPVIHDDTPYHRVILYISQDFFEQYRLGGTDLFRCFSLCAGCGSHILRMEHFQDSRLYPVIQEMILSAGEADEIRSLERQKSLPSAGFSDATSFGERSASLDLYQRSLLLQFLLLLNKYACGSDLSCPAPTSSNPQILQVLAYINHHLSEELSVDRIADACYLNRSYLMHLFRRETGYTLGSYITEKRLFIARNLIQSGTTITDACMQSGFSGYTSFYRAYRKKFGEPPKESRRNHLS